MGKNNDGFMDLDIPERFRFDRNELLMKTSDDSLRLPYIALGLSELLDDSAEQEYRSVLEELAVASAYVEMKRRTLVRHVRSCGNPDCPISEENMRDAVEVGIRVAASLDIIVSDRREKRMSGIKDIARQFGMDVPDPTSFDA